MSNSKETVRESLLHVRNNAGDVMARIWVKAEAPQVFKHEAYTWMYHRLFHYTGKVETPREVADACAGEFRDIVNAVEVHSSDHIDVELTYNDWP